MLTKQAAFFFFSPSRKKNVLEADGRTPKAVIACIVCYGPALMS